MKHSKSSLFLMEIIIAILFFSLASTVCIQLFVKAHLLSVQTIEQNHAVVSAQNLAELFLAAEGDFTQIADLYPACEADASNGTIMVFFDSEWKECDSSAYRYTSQLQLIGREASAPGSMISANIQVLDSEAPDDAIYSLQVKHHIPERSGSHE